MGPHPAVAAIRLAVRRVLHDILTELNTPAMSASAGAPTGPAAGDGGPDVPLAARPRRLLRRRRLDGAGLRPRLRGPAARCPRRRRHRRPRPPARLRPARRGGRAAAARDGPRPRRVHRRHRRPGRRTRGRRPRRPLRRLDAAAERHGAAAVLLGHTRDDQAETVLLGLARGSGIRSLSGMAAVSGADGRYRRPFLQLDRQTARKACMVQSLPVWDDPHNADPAYTRSRLRHEGLPALEKALGKGVVEALARTAQLSRDDADALDTWAARPRRASATPRAAWSAASSTRCPGGAPQDPAPRRHRGRCPGRLAVRPPHRGSGPADHRLARPEGHQPPGKVVARRQGGRLVIRQG